MKLTWRLLVCSLVYWFLVSVRVVPLHAQQEGAENPSGAHIFDLGLPEMDINQVLKIISDTSGWNIIPSQEVKGKVSVWLKDIDVEIALREIVEVNGFRLHKEGKTVQVLSEEEFEMLYGPETEQRVFALKHSSVTDLSASISPLLSKKGKVITDVRSNIMVVSDLTGFLDVIDKVIREMDQQVEIKVFRLRHAFAYDVVSVLEPLTTERGKIQADERSNQLVITETPENMRQLEMTIERLDTEDIYLTRTYTLLYANAEQVADIIYEMITGYRRQVGPGVGAQAGQPTAQVRGPRRIPASKTAPRYGTAGEKRPLTTLTEPRPAAEPRPPTVAQEQAPVSVPTAAEAVGEAIGPLETVVADPRTNTVIVTHVPKVLERVEEVIRILDVPRELYVHEFQYADLEKLALEGKLEPLLGRPAEEFQVDYANKKVTFRATSEKAERILKLFREWDEPPLQTLIEAVVLSVDLDFIRDLGVSLRMSDDDTAIVDLLFPPAIPAVPQASVQFGDLARSEYHVLLQALQSDDRTKLLSNPRVLALNDEEALFSVATDEPFTEIVTDANSDITREDTRFIPVGVILSVKPRANDDGIINMDVRVEVSNLQGYSTNNVPIVSRSQAQSRIQVEDSHTIIIGGLIFDERIESIRKVPFLGDIPILKYAFRSQKVDKSKVELIVFITPHVQRWGKPTTVPSLDDFGEKMGRGDSKEP
jgi:general secretion pathway protein D